MSYVSVRQDLIDRKLDKAAYHEERMWAASDAVMAEFHLNKYLRCMAIAEEAEAQIVRRLGEIDHEA